MDIDFIINSMALLFLLAIILVSLGVAISYTSNLITAIIEKFMRKK